jgi:hypothetical protein
MYLNPKNLTVGQRVAVSRLGSWRAISNGIYVVTSMNKVRVTLTREGDGHEHVVSVRTHAFRNYDGKLTDRSHFIETVEAMEARQAQNSREVHIRGLFSKAGVAASERDLATLEALVAELRAAQA